MGGKNGGDIYYNFRVILLYNFSFSSIEKHSRLVNLKSYFFNRHSKNFVLTATMKTVFIVTCIQYVLMCTSLKFQNLICNFFSGIFLSKNEPCTLSLQLKCFYLATADTHLISFYHYSGQETYENQAKYGKVIFEELNTLQESGITFDGFWHKIELVSCSDWKAAACIEGIKMIMIQCLISAFETFLLCKETIIKVQIPLTVLSKTY